MSSKTLLPTLGVILLAVSNCVNAGVSSETIKPGQSYYVSDRAIWGNCVKYARLFKSSLPYGLDSAVAKKKIINTSSAKKGRVAIMSVGPYWHVAYVTGVDDNGKSRSITVAEANYRTNQLTLRKATCSNSLSGCTKDLKIEGYFK